MATSRLERIFLDAWREYGMGRIPAREYRFHPIRKFRLDFAWPQYRLGVELDGFGGRHQTHWGFSADHEKMNLAAEADWVVLRYTNRQLGSKRKRRECCKQILRVLEMRRKRRAQILTRRLYEV